MTKKTLLPEKWVYLSPVHLDKNGAERLPGINFQQMFQEMRLKNVEYVRIEFEEIIDWDMAPMRKYMHGVVIPAFVKKFNDNASHPRKAEPGTIHKFTPEEVKSFLKARFLGFNMTELENNKWKSIFDLKKAVESIFNYIIFYDWNETIDDPVKVNSTESLEPAQYWGVIKEWEDYYFEVFGEMYDTSTKPAMKGATE